MLKYIVIGAILVMLYNMNMILGVAATVLCILYILFINRATFYARKGNVAFNENNQEKAIEWYKKACNTNNVSPGVMLTYGILLLRNAEPSEAITVFNLIAVNKKAKEDVKNKAKQYRALAYYKIGQTEDAMEEAQELFENYKNTMTYSLIGYLRLATKAPIEETLELCKEAYEYNSDERDICDNLALAYIEIGEYEKAKEILTELIKNHPEFVEAYYHMALVNVKTGDKEKAKEALENIENKTKRTYMTTVNEAEIEALRAQL